MTVSRVINDRPGVSPELRAQIRQLIEELDYFPSLTARNLALGKTYLIGVLVPDMVSEWISPLLLGIGAEAEESGFRMLVRSTGRGIALGPNKPNLFAESELADGLIVASWWVPMAYTESLVRHSKPLVLIDGYIRPSNVTWVSSAYLEGTVAAVKHLAELGHRQIAFLSGGSKPYVAQQQLTGFTNGMQEVGLTINPTWILEGDYTRESGYQLAEQLLSKSPRPTAVLAGNDPMAVGAMQVARELGLDIPADLSVAGFDDTLGASTVPPLTTVLRDFKETGRTAARLLIDQLENAVQPGTFTQVNLPTHLVVRQSTAAPRG